MGACNLGAKDDAGVVSLSVDNNGDRYGLVVSHESHNHSQIVPYEGLLRRWRKCKGCLLYGSK